MITTQSGAGSSISDFAIRSQLFSKDLDKKTQEKARNTEEATKHVNDIDFSKKVKINSIKRIIKVLKRNYLEIIVRQM
ncbi:hypothetical protein ICE98_03276 [Lactococcus lactis]|nr:hypothetical protein [Lactococcus lactis]